MDAAIYAERVYHAQAKLGAAAQILGDRLGLGDEVERLKRARHNEPDIQSLMQLEATANLLHSVVLATLPSEPVAQSVTAPPSEQAYEAMRELGIVTIDIEEPAASEKPTRSTRSKAK